MIKSRVWRFLTFFLGLYLLFLLIFLRSFGSDKNETSTASHPASPDSVDANPAERPKIAEPAARKNLAHLAPVMTENVLGNYEPKQLGHASGPGEDGAGVQLQGDEEKKRGEESVSDYGFNEVASEKISLDRRARDTRYGQDYFFIRKASCPSLLCRPPECKHWNYPNVDQLPTASVVLVFYDEGWSTLVRTFHSVINTSPKELLKDIILVDDYSDQEHITVRLPEYIKKWNGLIKYVRTPYR